jgi:hypothetical protein
VMSVSQMMEWKGGNLRPSFAQGGRWKESDRIALCIHPWSSFP